MSPGMGFHHFLITTRWLHLLQLANLFLADLEHKVVEHAMASIHVTRSDLFDVMWRNHPLTSSRHNWHARGFAAMRFASPSAKFLERRAHSRMQGELFLCLRWFDPDRAVMFVV